jgi:hypothetical protein
MILIYIHIDLIMKTQGTEYGTAGVLSLVFFFFHPDATTI